MQQWDRDTSGRLNRISTQPDLASEVSAQIDTMDPIPEEQQSQPGTPMNPNANRTMLVYRTMAPHGIPGHED